MNTDARDARRALDTLDRTAGRASAFAAYASAGPAFVAWGAVWLLCNGIAGLWPAYGGWAWMVGVPLGVAASILSGRKGFDDARDLRPGRTGRYLTSAAIIAGLITALVAVLGPPDARSLTAALSLAVAAAYALVGVWTGSRFIWVGLVLAAAVLAGWFLFQDWFELWMGAAGGGVLILTGLWLRRA